ncbi:hypothetical protein DBR32_13525 [Taibaiella sp. KBW10]|uniref:hypothetical protein n=1 Tax=Taibaiella sp. KBW10 TaxID=2153357 RepID=UPI000F59B507|nr:hypothetical protein [Taibaiella sp. KBW10]RQO30572.1 hypothetical protein DBR32_13525 [Taibaiella sp. KBW10]
MNANKEESLQVLSDIRSMMHKSSRFLSLSGWSGIWAGGTALIAAFIAHILLARQASERLTYEEHSFRGVFSEYNLPFIVLAAITFLVALAGALFFTYRKNKQQEQATITAAAKKLVISMFIPIAAAAWLIIQFIQNGDLYYIVPATLIFYGLTLINSSKYTFTDIRYLGLLEVALGCIAVLFPDWGLYFLAFGFGVLHILYGIIMWQKYDRK